MDTLTNNEYEKELREKWLNSDIRPTSKVPPDTYFIEKSNEIFDWFMIASNARMEAYKREVVEMVERRKKMFEPNYNKECEARVNVLIELLSDPLLQ